jgi:hypothetical protein
VSRIKIWTTAEGEAIPINCLENGHLLNILRYLERRAKAEFVDLPFPSSNGEMAQYYLEQAWEHAMAEGPGYCLPPIYDDLAAEAARRGLSWESEL